MSTREQLNSYIRQLERRLRLGAVLRGTAILTAAALAATVFLVLILNSLAFSSGSVTAARVTLLFALAFAAGCGLAIPLSRLNRRRAVGKAENIFPQFEQRLVTFAERDGEAGQPFIDLLAADTLKAARGAEPALLVPRNQLLASLGVGLASLGVLVWMVLAGPGYLGYGAALLWTGTHVGAAPFYDIRVSPGDAIVRRKADQLITALPIGVATDKVRLYARYQSASKWEQVTMQPQRGAPGFQFLFAGLPETVSYYVEAGSVRSRHFNIQVVDMPSVKNIRVTYHFPAWTGLENVVEERGGDLRAVEGTDAELEILMDRPLRDGVLVLDNAQQARLSGGEGNLYRGTVRMEKDGMYHVAAVDQGQPVRLSEDFFIEANKAKPPEVQIARPGRDYRASPIEEVTVSVKAQDEFALSDLSLHYSVNGGPEQRVSLLKGPGEKQADGSATLYLENFKMVPGDVVSLYATAKDARSESRTDMFFVEADPFEREFSQSQQSAGGGGGGGGGLGDQTDISQREKEIIAATWKQQGHKQASQQELAESGKFLSEVQSKLADQARSLSFRMQSRELSEANAEFTGFVKDMNEAALAMAPASEKLKQLKWDEAIPSEQKALQHLLRAEATFRQIQVAFGAAGGGAGGGGAGRDLASLFDLELDTEKNQYETGQTAGSADQRAQEIDDALKKLDELARREEELAAQQRNNSAQSFEQRWQQEMLRRDAEELQKQIEQLAKNSQQGQQGASGSSGQSSTGQSNGSQSGGSSDPRAQQALDRLRQAGDDMRRAASGQQSEAEARRAADRLREATNLLGGMQQQQAAGRLDSMTREADRLSKGEHDQADRLRKMFDQGGPGGSAGGGPLDSREQQSKLADDRQRLADDLSRLQKQMRDAERELASSQRPASSKLRDALGEMDQNDLETRIQKTADWLRRGINPNSNSTESEIAQGLESLSERMRQAQQALGPGGQQGSDTAVDRLERLRNRLESLDRGAGGRNAQSQDVGRGQQGPGGQPGQPGRGGQFGPLDRFGDVRGGGDRNGQRGYWGVDTGNNSNLPHPVAPDNSPVPDDPERVFRQNLSDLDQLRQSVANDPETLRDVQELIREMQRLDPSRFPGNPALVEQLHTQVLSDVEKLELQLRRQQDDRQSGQIRSGDPQPMPSGYQDAVAEYFRRLSNHQ
jgi:hypothetical protein